MFIDRFLCENPFEYSEHIYEFEFLCEFFFRTIFCEKKDSDAP